MRAAWRRRSVFPFTWSISRPSLRSTSSTTLWMPTVRARRRTPVCSVIAHLKFAALWQRAQQLGARWVATGHYAAVWQDQGDATTFGGDAIRAKTNPTFSSICPRINCGNTLLPLGVYRKEEVRQLAVRLGLKVAEKPESQEICFIPDGDYRTFYALV